MFGRLDILVNSAALDPKFDPESAEERLNHAGNGAFEDYPLQAWNQALNVNLTGAFLCVPGSHPADAGRRVRV